MNKAIPQSTSKSFDAESFERRANEMMQANLEHARHVKEAQEKGDIVAFTPEGVKIEAAYAQVN